MKILVLTKKMPFPLKDGESIAVHSLTKALVDRGVEVDLLSMNTSKHFVEVEAIRNQISHYNHVQTSYIDNRIKKKDALKNLFSRKSYHIVRFDYTDFRYKLVTILKSKLYDCILLESIYLTPYIDSIRKFSDANIIMRAHNVEHEIWHRISKQTTNIFKKIYLNIQVARLKKYELGAIRYLDGLISLTQRDNDFFSEHGYTGDCIVSPIGISIDSLVPTIFEITGNTIGFIGSLDWQPNIEGLFWFLRTVWPKVLRHHPEVEFHIAGRNPNKEILKISDQNVVVHGEVDSAVEFVSKHSIAVVPLLSGGGMRVKILEAMALKRVVISTSVGAEGIDTTGICIADTSTEFAEAISRFLKNPKEKSVLAQSAWENVRSNYDINKIAEKTIQFLKSKMANK